MKEFVDKLIGRLEEYRRFEDHDNLDRQCIDGTIQIVKELAEEHKDKDCSKCSRRSWYQKGYEDAKKNNGWIPVSERLPKTPKEYVDYYWCTLKSKNEKLKILGTYKICKVVRYERFANGNFWMLSREDKDINEYEVVAWQPLPTAWEGE